MIKKPSVKYILLPFSIALLLAIINYNTSNYISNRTWKYYGGVSSGDVIEFETNHRNKEALKMKSLRPGNVVFCFHKFLIIRNSENGKLGTYIYKKGLS